MEPLLNADALRALVRALVREELDRREARDDYMTAAEAAAVVRLKPATIREWVKAGRLRARRVGRQLRITRFDLEAAMAAGNGKRTHETVESRARSAARSVLGRVPSG